jgi:hypothetical protein
VHPAGVPGRPWVVGTRRSTPRSLWPDFVTSAMSSPSERPNASAGRCFNISARPTHDLLDTVARDRNRIPPSSRPLRDDQVPWLASRPTTTLVEGLCPLA